MAGRKPMRRPGRGLPVTLTLALLLALFPPLSPPPLGAQSNLPGDRIHISVALGGYFMLGVGYTHWVEQHHALEFTLFPLVQPGEGFPVGLRAGHAWIPSDEVWKAKLGANVTLLVEPWRERGDRFIPILALTPGIQYEPDSDLCWRGDLWMSYFPTQHVFAPTTIEILSGWKK